MADGLQSTLELLIAGHDLDAQSAYEAVSTIMDGRATEVEIAAFLTALRIKGEAVDEIVGAAHAMREHATPIPTQQSGLLDTCGTGGDKLHTFNISTATAIVAAAAGVPVAKHGNRSVSSSSGSADVLEELGVNIELTSEQVSCCLDEIGIGFCFAPLIHGAMKYAAPVRKQLVFRTVFNLLGPLTNPAGAEFQLLGVNDVRNAEKMARALMQLGSQRAVVVCGADSLDEVSLWGETTVFLVSGNNVTTEHWSCETFGLSECRVEDLQVHSAKESAEMIRSVLNGEKNAARDIVLANTAAALLAARLSDDLRQATMTAAEVIDSGKAIRQLDSLIEFTNR